MPSKNEPASLIDPKIIFDPVQVKVLKIVAKPIRALPKWHGGKGKPGWVFVNEIVVN